MRALIAGLLQSVKRVLARRRLPAGGFRPSAPRSFVEALPDDDLALLNRILPWHAFVADGRGRRFGDVAWSGKRADPQVIPDRRTAMLDQRFGLAGKSVLEIGCFEGIHTIGLCRTGARVTAIDSRIENVAKTVVRAAMFDCWPRAYVQDIERTPTDETLLAADVAHHVGVLYHLKDPVAHLVDLGRYIKDGIMLDTHVARPEEVNASYESLGRSWRYYRYGEFGRADPFSGMYDHAKWLPLDELQALLALAGFTDVEIAETRDERNGLRVLLFARRNSA
jgi:SAM-dependent methyltransferase